MTRFPWFNIDSPNWIIVIPASTIPQLIINHQGFLKTAQILTFETKKDSLQLKIKSDDLKAACIKRTPEIWDTDGCRRNHCDSDGFQHFSTTVFQFQSFLLGENHRQIVDTIRFPSEIVIAGIWCYGGMPHVLCALGYSPLVVSWQCQPKPGKPLVIQHFAMENLVMFHSIRQSSTHGHYIANMLSCVCKSNKWLKHCVNK